jgi:penicillin-binding protein 1A
VEGKGFTDENRRREKRVFPAEVGQLAKEMLSTVVTSGTGKAAAVGDEFIWGKTGTTENYGDAWFAGGNDDYSVAVWVGYADRLQPMEYEHAGGPVAGGTFPAEIFHDFMTAALAIKAERDLARDKPDDDEDDTATGVPAAPVTPSQIPPAEQSAPSEGGPAEPQTGGNDGATPAPEAPQQAPEPAPAPTPAPTPAPAPTTPPSSGTGGGAGAAPP